MDALTLTPEQALADIEAALATGQRNRAIDLAVAAMGRGITPTLVLSLVAEGMEQDGLIADSLALFNRAQFEAPDDIAAKLAFARALSRHGADAEAVAPLEAVLAREPGNFEALMLRGKVAAALGDLKGAGAAYEQAWAARPDRGEPLAELALLAARRGDMASARARGLHALALSPGASRAAVAVARADLSEGKAGDARARLERAMVHPKLTEAADRADVLTYLGDALDALDLPAEAFAAWREREAVLRPSRAKAISDGAGDRHIILARRLAAWFGGIPHGAWRAAPGASDDGNVAGHAFVLSFPRSGTTLLEQVLAAHPGVVARDESEALATAADHLIRDDAGLTALARLTADEAEAARAAYWKQMRREIGEDLAGKVLIDKNPLNSMRLPIIAKLFPGARIIFAERDPRDVVLSGYRRLYYSQMLEFHTLDGAARFYDAVMRVTDIYRARLTLEAHTVRHETLVTDFEGEARRVLAFLGLEWTPAVLDFARGPVISITPSAAQVAQGLNAEGVGQWRRYEDAMAPVLPILEPWAAKLGYEPAPLSPTGATPNDRDAQFVSAVPELTAALRAVEADLKAGRLPAAMAKSEDALARGLADPLFHRLRGVRAQQQGRLDLAIADFEAVLAQAGEDAPVLNALGLCLARAGRAAEGLARLDRAIALNGRAAPFHFNRGWALEAAGDLPAARRAYETALGIDPKHAQAQANLAMLAARAADWPQTRALAARALELDPASPAAATALARAEAAFGDTVAARTRLQSVVAGQRADPHERAVALSALGDVLDQSGEADAAFAAYDQGARILRGLYAPRFTGTEATSALAARLDESLAGMDKAKWRRGAPTPDATGPKKHIFLLGFPRSGTTMLGQALAGHPDVVTLDERSTLRDAAQTYLFPPHGLARLAAAGAEDLAPHRAAYWARVREGGAEPRGRVFIDKLPMNTLGLPLILKLFPNAKILFLRRDPRDVVLSCLRRQFVIDATTIELLGLESAAGLYDRIMRLMETSRGVLDLDLREQSYETLVEAFEPQMREICAFIGLPYDPAMANFAGRAHRVATPSAAQIAQGLNSEGVGVWRRYQAPLAPVMDQLAPWIARFGYDTN